MWLKIRIKPFCQFASKVQLRKLGKHELLPQNILYCALGTWKKGIDELKMIT
jgi:hypothetical protein